jgi:hypothetical protein
MNTKQLMRGPTCYRKGNVTGNTSARSLCKLQSGEAVQGHIERSMFPECDAYYVASTKMLRRERRNNKCDLKAALKNICRATRARNLARRNAAYDLECIRVAAANRAFEVAQSCSIRRKVKV